MLALFKIKGRDTRVLASAGSINMNNSRLRRPTKIDVASMKPLVDLGHPRRLPLMALESNLRVYLGMFYVQYLPE